MAIKINNSLTNFDNIQVIEFRYIKRLGQVVKGTLFIRWQLIHIDTDVNKSWSDNPIQELFIKDVDASIMKDVMSGEMSLFNAFQAMQIGISDLINESTGLDTEYEVD